MISLFTKRMEQLDISDVKELIASEMPESSMIEYKRSLSHPEGGEDEWYKGASGISAHARNEILEEVIAFANAQGGTVCLGIEETKVKPPRACGVFPIPKCHELAERLLHQIRDCVEPQIPLVAARGIDAGDEPGLGVVVIRVERSHLAPHRLNPNRECYVRRADRTEKMTMREIQDLTLQTDRGSARLDANIERQRQRFREWLRIGIPSPTYVWAGCRVTAAPLWPLQAERVYDSDIFLPARQMQLQDRHQVHQLNLPRSPALERPILRGAQRNSGDGHSFQEMFLDGLCEVRFRSVGDAGDGPVMFPEWALAAVGNTLMMVDRFRDGVGTPAAEFALEVEIAQTPGPIQMQWGVGVRAERIEIESPCLLPRLSVGPRDEFGRLMGIVYNDLRNASGLPSSIGPFDLHD